MGKSLIILSIALMSICQYGIIGTSGNVERIKTLIEPAMQERGWKIIRYDGYQWGSFKRHGGTCWYHVCNKNNNNIQYQVGVSLWGDELQFWYGEPETLNRVDLKIKE